ncbi:uncharacterized protein C11orf87 [Gasterosteus aculeatus]|uniref:Si:dkey-183i3.9 n=1 Tax=Gasterosteus aculeatus TaxID=69293 RepID=G3QC24_GASAC|nr:uncharacterized protein C11orf87 homolog [Gasterosteus aculeatus aculeatus]XP_040039195.1 uncharacterized protein C11orf87 homolog [Gasterosteus aculeatus aculeatus]
MTARTPEASGPSVPLHRCHGVFQARNGTCAEPISFFPPFSSTLALLVLVAVLAGIVLVSLATFHFHKRKLRKRKILRAQEEYERDRRSPARGEPARPCVIVRPARREERPSCRDAETGDAGVAAAGGRTGAAADGSS